VELTPIERVIGYLDLVFEEKEDANGINTEDELNTAEVEDYHLQDEA